MGDKFKFGKKLLKIKRKKYSFAQKHALLLFSMSYDNILPKIISSRTTKRIILSYYKIDSNNK
jgi:hypothetical protein